ncbi:MAG: sensor histidine kinase [Methanocella sp.]
MIKFRSIKAKSVAYTLLIMLVPVIVLGTLGTLYYHDVIRQNVQNDYMEEARTIGALTANFLDRSVLELEMQSGRSTLINALDRRDVAALDEQADKINDAMSHYYQVYVTDTSGRVLSGSPYGSLAGKDLNDSPCVTEPLQTGKTVAGPPSQDARTGRLTRFVCTPIKRNDTTIGVLVGALDIDQFIGILQSARSLVPLQSIYLVNQSGHVVFSHNKTDVIEGMNISSVAAAQKVIRGGEGFDDHANLTPRDAWMVAYSPVPGYPLGTLIAMPGSVVDRPIKDATVMMALIILFLAALAVSLALAVGNYMTGPIHRISTAAEQYRPGMDLSKYLPYDREDELGHLARSFKEMSERITNAREKVLGEKKRSDLYVDVMGHDINNLNQIILSNIDLAQQTGSLDDRQRKFLDGAKQAVSDSAAIIRDVKAVQAAIAGTVQPGKVDLDDVLQECIKEAPRPENQRISFRYTPHKGRIVSAVPDIKRAFCNVIDERARNAGAPIDIGIDVSEAITDGKKTYVTTISDDGPGIPDNVKKMLFTRFQQDSAVPPGKGLGFYTAKVLVEASGGMISVEDLVPGDYTKGAKVVITLPAATDGEGS